MQHGTRMLQFVVVTTYTSSWNANNCSPRGEEGSRGEESFDVKGCVEPAEHAQDVLDHRMSRATAGKKSRVLFVFSNALRQWRCENMSQKPHYHCWTV